MRLFYIANARMPTERAHGIQIAKMCEAFAKAGVEVHLLLPRRKNLRTDDVFTAYGLEKNFSVEYLPTIALPLWLPGAFALQTFTFALSTKRRLAREESAVVYTRGEMVLFLAKLLPARFKLVWETHIKPTHPVRYARAVQRASALVTVTKYYAREIPALWQIPGERVFYAPDGVSLEAFTSLPSKEDARAKLKLAQDKKLVLYSGSDLPWKGLRFLREASALLPADYMTVFVGLVEPGTHALPNQYFAGVRPHEEVPLWLTASDVLVLTGDPTAQTAQHYTSPMKLFEYLAAERPIVAMDLPSFRDVLSEENAFLCAPDAKSLATSIRLAVEHAEDATARATRARQDAARYTWDARAKNILAFLAAQRD